MQTIIILTERLDNVVSQLFSTKHDGVALAFLKTAEIDTSDRFPLNRRSRTHQANLSGQKDLLDHPGACEPPTVEECVQLFPLWIPRKGDDGVYRQDRSTSTYFKGEVVEGTETLLGSSFTPPSPYGNDLGALIYLVHHANLGVLFGIVILVDTDGVHPNPNWSVEAGTFSKCSEGSQKLARQIDHLSVAWDRNELAAVVPGV